MSSLATQVKQAVFLSSLATVSLKLIALVSSMVISRLLTPSEIGVFAIASAFVVMIGEFRILGIVPYLIREKELSEQKKRSALGLAIGVSWLLALFILVISPHVADYYQIEGLAPLFQVFAFSFLFSPYISLSTALLSRNFAYARLFVIQVVPALIGFLVTVAFIYAGHSFYSLVYGHLVGILLNFLFALLLRPAEMVFMPAFTRLREIAVFGFFISISSSIRNTTLLLPDMILGKLSTPAQVAFFSRGVGFIEFISQGLLIGVNAVALPYLSAINRRDEDLNRAYIKLSVLVGGVVVPVMAVASLSSVPIIRLFFGSQWDFSASIASYLALWGCLRVVHWFSNSMFMATQHEKIMFYKELVIFVAYFAVIVVASKSGLLVLAQSFIFLGLLELVLTSYLLHKTHSLDLTQLAFCWAPTLGVAFNCALATVGLAALVDFNDENYLYPLLYIASCLPVVWLFSLRVFKHQLYDELVPLLNRVNAGLKLNFRFKTLR